jgi:uncharacterized protein YbjT (DUF2867 family)
MILIVGATGWLGNRITYQLLQAQHDVRIVTRPDSPYQALADAGAQPAFGDLKDPQSLKNALRGVDTLITTASAGQRSGMDTIETVDLKGNRNLIEAAEQAGVRQFIFVSTLGSDPNSPLPLFQAKGMTEARLRQSHISYTILQPTPNLDVWVPLIVGLPLQQQRSVTLIGQGHRKHSFVAQQDVAAFAVAAVGNRAAHNQTIQIGGPVPISWRDIIAAVEVALDRPIHVNTVAVSEKLPSMPPSVNELMAALETFDAPLNMQEAVQTFGIELTPLETWITSSFVPWLNQQPT